MIIVKCQYCGIDYSNKSIKKHMGDMHPEKFYTDENKKLEVKCSQCDEIFGSYNSKYLHTVPCKKTRLFHILPYKMSIFS